jgi:glycerate dehydrogenase
MRIVVLDAHTVNPGDNSWHGLERYGDVLIYARTSPDELLQRALSADILILSKNLLMRKCWRSCQCSSL